LFFFVLFVGFFYKILFTGKIYYTGDILTQFKPWMVYAAAEIKTGNVPLWNPYSYGGTPFAANMQTAVFYPPNIIFQILPFPAAFRIYILFHIFLAWLFTFYLMKEMGARDSSSFIAGVIYAFNGYTVSRIVFLSVFAASVWLPAEFLILLKALKSKDKKNLTILLGIIFALQFLAGHPQVVFYSILFLLFFACFRALSARRLDAFCILGLSGILAAFLSAVQLIPSFEFVRLSVRGVPSGLDYGMASTNSLPWTGLLNFVNPFFKYPQKWAYSCYVGVAAFFLVCVGAASSGGKIRRFLIFIFIISVLWALGSNTFIFKFIYRSIPFFRMVRFPATALFLSVFSVSLLAGLGCDVKNVPDKLKAAAALVMFFELFSTGQKFNPAASDKFFKFYGGKTAFLIQRKGGDRFFLTRETDDDRAVSDIIQWRDDLHGNINLCYGLFNAAGEDPMRVGRFSVFLKRAFLNKDLDRANGPLSLLNVRYVLSKNEIESDKYKLVFPGRVKIYENKNCLPRSFFVATAVKMKDEKIMDYITGDSFFPASEVVFEGRDEKIKGATAIKNECEILKYEPGKVIINVKNSHTGYLVLSDTFYPGWRAYIDGIKTQIYRADYVFRAVKVPSGEHTVKFIYEPLSYKIGQAFTLLTIAFIFLLVLKRVKSEEKKVIK